MQAKSYKEPQENYHAEVGDLRTGSVRTTKSLVYGKENAPNNFKVSYGGDGSAGDWTTPRHRHTFEQIRYCIQGDYVIRPGEVMPAGWLCYFPESVYYGPQVKAGNLRMLTIQFGGPSGIGYWSMKQRKMAFKELEKRGEIKDGIFHWTDEQGRRHQRDAAEACQDIALGKTIEYPEPRYKDLVMINPANFEWRKEAAGIGRKHLGTFTERDMELAFIRLDKGATFEFGNKYAPEAMFMTEGAITHENQRYDAETAFAIDNEEQPVQLKAIEPTELVYYKLPAF